MGGGGRKQPSSLVSSERGVRVGAKGPHHSKRATDGSGVGENVSRHSFRVTDGWGGSRMALVTRNERQMGGSGRKQPLSLVSSDGGVRVGAKGPRHSKQATDEVPVKENHCISRLFLSQ